MMLPLVTYEMVRRLNEERLERSMRRFWWRYSTPSEMPDALSGPVHEADVIEIGFGARCEAEEPIGA